MSGKITAYRNEGSKFVRVKQSDFKKDGKNPLTLWNEFEAQLTDESCYKQYKKSKYILSLMKYNGKQAKIVAGYNLNETLVNELFGTKTSTVATVGKADIDKFTKLFKNTKVIRSIDASIAMAFNEKNEKVNWKYDEKSYEYIAEYKDNIAPINERLYSKNRALDRYVRDCMKQCMLYNNGYDIKGVRIFPYEYAGMDGLLISIVTKTKEVYSFFMYSKKNRLGIKHIQVLKSLFEKDLMTITERVEAECSPGEEIYAVNYTFYGEYPSEKEMEEFYALEDDGYMICFDD